MKVYTLKLLSRLLALFCMFLFMLGIALADESYYSNEFDEQDFENINNSLNYLGYNSNDIVYFTEFIPVQDSKTMVSLIYDEEQLIGEYVKHPKPKGVYGTFIIDNADSLYGFITAEKPTLDGSLINPPSSTTFNIEDVTISESATADNTFFPTAKSNGDYEIIGQPQANYLISSSSEGEIILVNPVANATDPANGKGLCWVACGASIINYFKGTSYTTLSLYSKIKEMLGVSTLVGTRANTLRMYQLFFSSVNSITNKLSYTNVLNILGNGSPIYCSIGTTAVEENHGIVLCGAFRISSTYGYVFMDPNIANHSTDRYVIIYYAPEIINNNSKYFYFYWENIVNGVKYTSQHSYQYCDYMIYNFIE